MQSLRAHPGPTEPKPAFEGAPGDSRLGSAVGTAHCPGDVGLVQTVTSPVNSPALHSRLGSCAATLPTLKWGVTPAGVCPALQGGYTDKGSHGAAALRGLLEKQRTVACCFPGISLLS